MLSETPSLRKCARARRKQFCVDDQTENTIRKRRRKQLCVMAEVLCVDTREVLRNATLVSLSLDEPKYRKVVRDRADVPAPGGGVRAPGYRRSGVLGVLDCRKSRAAEFEEGHAATAAKQLGRFLSKFCTPLGRGRRKALPLACDESLKSHVLETVTSTAAAGAAKERRAVFLAARELFPNLLIVIRGPAHAMRLASQSSHCDDVFGEVRRELFANRRALAPDIMSSDAWRNLFVAIQEDNLPPLAEAGLGRKPLEAVVRSLSFAKQRFDSTAGPVGEIALMLLPVATLLACIASDERHGSEQRERAATLLEKLDTKFCMVVGASADWGIICNWFLRLLDVANHDIAASRLQIVCMVETPDAVFKKGFGDLPCLKTRKSILRGVRQVAAALGCDEAAAAQQYQDAPPPFMVQQFSAGKPLSEKTNQEAWARLLDDAFWHAACPKRLVGGSRALRQPIRFYISIEGGECAVERDFAFFRNKMVEQRTSDVDFLDDCLISSTARFGHCNPAGTRAASLKRAATRGVLRRATVGVLAAACLAAQCKLALVASAALHPGAGTGRSTRWSDDLQKFHRRSVRNIAGVTQVRAAPGGVFLMPPGADLAASRGARLAPEGPSPRSQVAVLAAPGAIGETRLRGSGEVKGAHRCALASLVVVRGLAILHDSASLAADADLTASFLYIVALRLDVVASVQLAAARCAP
ncbi:unnamed protein product, partial [Prorocentrum cordatum]